MPLTRKRAEDQARVMLGFREAERRRLERLHSYRKGDYKFQWLSPGVPVEVRRIADISRVNVCRFVVNSTVQSIYAEGFRAAKEADNHPAWDIWQANRFDARQTGVHRASLTYGASYVTVLPGDNGPVIRGASPRKLTVVYGEDDDWPMWALEKRGPGIVEREDDPTPYLYRLIDDEAVYWLSVTHKHGEQEVELAEVEEHGLGVVPVVRFLSSEDLDDDVEGEIEPIIPLQDQINLTTFGLLVAQHYGAFRQRYIIGWLAESEQQLLKMGADRLISFEDSEVEVGEFGQTELKGYIDSREASSRFLATLAQRPVHELQGQLVNLSAEALVAARDSADRMEAEKQVLWGEKHEQVLNLSAEMGGAASDHSAQIRWRDMGARSFSQTADALSKLKNIGVPLEMLMERVPGWTDQDVERAKALLAEGDSFGQLAQLLEQQAADGPPAN